ncbi:unnamed protein product, partial [Owenia fusiformis]
EPRSNMEFVVAEISKLFQILTIFTILVLIYKLYIIVDTDFYYYTYSGAPPLWKMMFKAFYRSLCKSLQSERFENFANEDEVQSQVQRLYPVVARNCRIDENNLMQYMRICGTLQESKQRIPACYLETLFLGPIFELVSSKNFLFSPLGLIHMKQTITVHRSLDVLLTQPFDLQVALTQYTHTDRGIETTLKLKVLDKSEVCVWEGDVVFLTRNKHSSQSGGHRIRNQTAEEEGSCVEVHVPSKTGVDYAHVSSDWNPHHLWTWTARPLGYKQPIAHGMWTLARTMAVLGSSDITVKPP